MNLLTSFLVAAAALVATAPIQERVEWQALSRLDAKLKPLVLTWLDHDCGARELPTLAEQLRASATKVEPAFWEAVELGPPPEVVEPLRKALTARYVDRQRWLRQFGVAQMGRDATEQQLAISEAEYVERAVARAIKGWRSKALAGLGVVGDRTTAAKLEPLATDPANPLRGSARAAISAISVR